MYLIEKTIDGYAATAPIGRVYEKLYRLERIMESKSESTRLGDMNALRKRFENYYKDCEDAGNIVAARVFADCIAEIDDAPTIVVEGQ